MTAAVLRVEPARGGDIDGAFWELRRVRLERCPQGLFLAYEEDATMAMQLVWRAGLRAEPGTPGPVGAGLIPSVVGDLEPRGTSGILDRITLRALDPGEASLLLRSRRLLGWRCPRYAARVQALLHEEDRMYSWTRRIWATPAALRSRELRGARAMVFDRGSVDGGVERYGFVRDGRLARWLAA